MTSLKLSLAFGLAGISAAISAQTFTIKSSIHIEGLPAEMASMADMDMVTYIKGEKVKTESSGMMGSRTQLFDGEKTIFLSEMMGNKMGYTSTKAEMEANDKNTPPQKPTFEYTDEKKTIAGYECTKVVMKMTSGKQPMTAYLWVTDKLVIAKNPFAADRTQGNVDFSELKGHPLGMEFPQSRNGQTTSLIITATEVSTDPIDDSVFVLDTTGYKMMSYAEMMSSLKAMRGGR